MLFNALSNGTFNMSGGTLNTGNTIVGENTIGVFNQSIAQRRRVAIEGNSGVSDYDSRHLTWRAMAFSTGHRLGRRFRSGVSCTSRTAQGTVSGDLRVGDRA
ncbi:MAG: hypothetical protein IPI89_14260 [Propionivibrio sp.]|nr:hypothetical protein [Propionivibrio sp.]